jgi:cell division protein FtsI/penicillin-binding protein 2
MQRRRATGIAAGVAAVVLIIGAVWYFGARDETGGSNREGMSEGDPASEAADAFAAAWTQGRLAEVPVTETSGDIAAGTEMVTAGLGLGEVQPSVRVSSLRRSADESEVTAEIEVTWPLDAERRWSYRSYVDLQAAQPDEGVDGGDDGAKDRQAGWRVAWTPAVVHPDLGPDQRLELERIPAQRGAIRALDGSVLVGDRPVVLVGIRPDQTTDRSAAAQQVAAAVGVDAADLERRVLEAPPSTVVSVITLRAEAFEEVRAALEPISGVVLTESQLPLAPTRDFARALLGTVGPATTEIAAASQGRIAEGEITGLSGIQASQDAVLAGTVGLVIRAVPPTPGGDPVVLEEFPPVPGRALTLTLDPVIQQAADATVATAPNPAALVVIRVSTGDVVAVANGPAGANAFNRAMVGRYPPGSVFKVASALAMVDRGITPESTIACPATIVAGKEFGNAGGFALGEVPFRIDFARSCNTAFVSQAGLVPDEALTATAEVLGYRALELGTPVFGGSVPLTDSEAEHASNMIGQGKVTASPLAVALASASVAAGRSLEPRLIVDPEGSDPQTGDPIPGAATVRDLMRAVVTEGTGTALADVPGGEVFGKTGTAEYGTDDPPATHAWFTGFQGDLAFAVLVEDGSSGGTVAAPLAARLLTELASR